MNECQTSLNERAYYGMLGQRTAVTIDINDLMDDMRYALASTLQEMRRKNSVDAPADGTDEFVRASQFSISK